jgi:hypothetical protein
MAKDLPSFIAKEGATREGAVLREKNFIDANNYETVAYLKHLDVRNEPKMVLFENVPALNGKKSEFPMFYNPWVSRQYVADSLDMGDIKSPMDVSLEVARLEQQQGKRPGKSAGQGSRAHRRQSRSARSTDADAPERRRRSLPHHDLRHEGAKRRLLRHHVYQE